MVRGLWIIGVLEKLLLVATTVNPLIFRALKRRAVGIGLSAGAFEAACLGVMAMAGSELMVFGQAGFGVSALIPPVERVMVIACHAAARAMTLYAVATGRWSWFWGGFALFSARWTVFTHLVT